MRRHRSGTPGRVSSSDGSGDENNKNTNTSKKAAKKDTKRKRAASPKKTKKKGKEKDPDADYESEAADEANDEDSDDEMEDVKAIPKPKPRSLKRVSDLTCPFPSQLTILKLSSKRPCLTEPTRRSILSTPLHSLSSRQNPDTGDVDGRNDSPDSDEQQANRRDIAKIDPTKAFRVDNDTGEVEGGGLPSTTKRRQYREDLKNIDVNKAFRQDPDTGEITGGGITKPGGKPDRTLSGSASKNAPVKTVRRLVRRSSLDREMIPYPETDHEESPSKRRQRADSPVPSPQRKKKKLDGSDDKKKKKKGSAAESTNDDEDRNLDEDTIRAGQIASNATNTSAEARQQGVSSTEPATYVDADEDDYRTSHIENPNAVIDALKDRNEGKRLRWCPALSVLMNIQIWNDS